MFVGFACLVVSAKSVEGHTDFDPISLAFRGERKREEEDNGGMNWESLGLKQGTKLNPKLHNFTWNFVGISYY